MWCVCVHNSIVSWCISHCTACVIPTYRQTKPLPLPEPNLYHTFFSSQNTTNLQDPVHPQSLGNGCATDLQPLGDGGPTDLQPLRDSQDAADLQPLRDSQDAADLQPLGDSQDAADLQPPRNGDATDLQPLGDSQDAADLQLLSPYLCTATPTSIYTDLPILLNYIKVTTCLFFNKLAPIAIYITIYCYPTDPPLLPTPAWAFPPPSLPMHRTPHEVPNPSHT